MPQEYTITRVSSEPPREWKGEHGTTYYIKCMLEGWSKPVSIGKKDPNALKAGDKVYGTIKTTDYPEDSFKAEKPAFSGGSYKRDDNAIKAQWAIGQAVAMTIANGKLDMDAVETDARKLFEMVERVKDHKPTLRQQFDNLPRQQTKKERDAVADYDPSEDPLAGLDEEPIDVSQIPF